MAAALPFNMYQVTTLRNRTFRQRSWKEHWPHYIRVHSTEFIDDTLNDCVSLDHLMCEWGSRSFRSTSENLFSGSANKKPRAALRRAPDVHLSGEAGDWLAGELDYSR